MERANGLSLFCKVIIQFLSSFQSEIEEHLVAAIDLVDARGRSEPLVAFRANDIDGRT